VLAQIEDKHRRLPERLGQLEGELCYVDRGQDLTSVNKQLKKLQSMECRMEEWYREVGDLQVQASSMSQQGQVKETVAERQAAVETRMVRLIEPLKERRRLLLASKEVHQVRRDLEDEIEHGSTLQSVQQLMKKNQSLQKELHGHRARVEDVVERASLMAPLRLGLLDVAEEEVEDMGLHQHLPAALPHLQQLAPAHVQLLQPLLQGGMGQRGLLRLQQLVDRLQTLSSSYLPEEGQEERGGERGEVNREEKEEEKRGEEEEMRGEEGERRREER
ncbi:LOW QUALITY PROTEIN: hypothetical protein CRUP_027493, partial [Coryphaenoides rupestris]